MAQAQGGQEPDGQGPAKAAAVRDARWWTGLSVDAKNTFLDGYTAAMSRVSNSLFTECAEKMKKIQSKIMSNPRTVLPQGEVTQSWNLCVLGGSFEFGFEQRDLRIGVDEFYKDTKNSHVLIDVAMQHVRDVLQKTKRPEGAGIGSPGNQ